MNTEHESLIEILPAHGLLPLNQPFTPAQAREAGVSDKVLRRLVRDGLVRRVLRGVYIDSAAGDDLSVRSRALSLVVPETAIVTDESAAWTHGVDVLRRGDHIHLPPLTVFALPGSTRVRLSGTDGGERSFVARDLEVINGVRVTTPLRTALDLGRLRSRDQAIGALDGLLRIRGLDQAELRDELERFKGFRGVVQLRELAAITDPRAESPAESVMRLRWLDANLPAPELQIPILGDWGLERYRADMGLPEIRYAAEYDGSQWHSSPESREHDRERRKWMRKERGWTVDVLMKGDVFGAHQRAAAIFRGGIARAGGLYAPSTRQFRADTPPKVGGK